MTTPTPRRPESALGTIVTYVLILLVLVLCALIWKQAHAQTLEGVPLGGHSATFDKIERWMKDQGPLPAPSEPDETAATEESVKRMMGAK